MHTVARSFATLMDVLSHHPESPDVPCLLAEVAARLATLATFGAAPHPWCLALQTGRRAHWPLSAAAALLAPYGVVLTARPRDNRDGVWLYGMYQGTPEPSPFAGARVRVLEAEDILSGAVELKRAA